MSIWTEWSKYRNSLVETLVDPKYPVNEIITELNDEDLNHWMRRFIVEIWRRDQTPYPPDTLVQITSLLQRTIRDHRQDNDFSFFQWRQFQGFRDALDTKMKSLRGEGYGTKRKSNDPVTRDDENKLWNSGVFTLKMAQGLRNIVFLYNGCTFAFRGMEEHKSVCTEQFEITTDTSAKDRS